MNKTEKPFAFRGLVVGKGLGWLAAACLLMLACYWSGAAESASAAVKKCFACNGTGLSKCVAPGCVKGQIDCPGPCLKLSYGKWVHMYVDGHDTNELWQVFQTRAGSKAFNDKHIGEVVVLTNGEAINLGKCSICDGASKVPCPACQGKGSAVCAMCNGQKTVPAEWTAASNPKTKVASELVAKQSAGAAKTPSVLPTSTGVQTFVLADGTSITGEVTKSSFNKDGVTVKPPGQSWLPRVAWDKLSRETLELLASNPDASIYIPEKTYAVPIGKLVESKREARQINVRPVEGALARPQKVSGLTAAFYSPIYWVLFLLIYGTNIYAAYEIAVFKNRPYVLVCGAAAAVPVVGPLAFYCLPPGVTKRSEAEPASVPPPVPPEAEAEVPAVSPPPLPPEVMAQPEVPQSRPTPAPVRLPAFGQTAQAAAAPPEPAPNYPEPVHYLRGQFIFNRRFFETRFAGFFRPVPPDELRDMVLVIRAVRGEFVVSRLSKVDQESVTLLVGREHATADEAIPFIEINAVTLKHRDGP